MEPSPTVSAKCPELVKLVLGLVLDSNFKIALTSMQILTIIAAKVKTNIQPTLFVLVPNVVEVNFFFFDFLYFVEVC